MITDKERLDNAITKVYNNEVRERVIGDYLKNYYEYNKSKFDNIDYEEYVKNSGYDLLTAAFTERDEGIYVDYTVKIIPYKSTSSKLFPLHCSIILDKETYEFKDFNYDPEKMVLLR